MTVTVWGGRRFSFRDQPLMPLCEFSGQDDGSCCWQGKWYSWGLGLKLLIWGKVQQCHSSWRGSRSWYWHRADYSLPGPLSEWALTRPFCIAALQAGMKVWSGTRGRGQGAKELKWDSKTLVLDTQCAILVGPRRSKTNGAGIFGCWTKTRVKLHHFAWTPPMCLQKQFSLEVTIESSFPVSHLRTFWLTDWLIDWLPIFFSSFSLSTRVPVFL